MAPAIPSATELTSQNRTAREIILRTIIIHAFAIASFGHSGSLLNVPSKKGYNAARLVAFAFLPAIVPVQLFISTTQALERAVTSGNSIFSSRTLSGALGMYPSPETHGGVSLIRLSMLPHAIGQKTTWEWTWERVGRIAVVFMALSQAVGTLLLWFRRRRHVSMQGEHSNGLGSNLNIDTRNAWVAFGSLMANFCVLILLLLGKDWTIVSDKQTETLADRQASAQITARVLQSATGVVCEDERPGVLSDNELMAEEQMPTLDASRNITEPAHMRSPSTQPPTSAIVTIPDNNTPSRNDIAIVEAATHNRDALHPHYSDLAYEVVIATYIHYICVPSQHTAELEQPSWSVPPVGWTWFGHSNSSVLVPAVVASFILLRQEARKQAPLRIAYSNTYSIPHTTLRMASNIVMAALLLWALINVVGVFVWDCYILQYLRGAAAHVNEDEFLRRVLWQDPLADSIPVI